MNKHLGQYDASQLTPGIFIEKIFLQNLTNIGKQGIPSRLYTQAALLL